MCMDVIPGKSQTKLRCIPNEHENLHRIHLVFTPNCQKHFAVETLLFFPN